MHHTQVLKFMCKHKPCTSWCLKVTNLWLDLNFFTKICFIHYCLWNKKNNSEFIPIFVFKLCSFVGCSLYCIDKQDVFISSCCIKKESEVSTNSHSNSQFYNCDKQKSTTVKSYYLQFSEYLECKTKAFVIKDCYKQQLAQ